MSFGARCKYEDYQKEKEENEKLRKELVELKKEMGTSRIK
jgi:hypothetical protein